MIFSVVYWVILSTIGLLCSFCMYYYVGMLLRLFSYLYDMDVIEEESFFKWKEDVPQEFPGKGQALFQVCNSL